MDKKVLIKATDLGIMFAKQPQTFLKDRIKNFFLSKEKELNKIVWKDINFEVHDGEIICVLGKNGRGKSTLLKIIAGLLQPDFGKVTLNTKDYLLLTPSLGFTDELTGRDNIYYCSIFLGMTKQDVQEKFDSIVAFAELEEHIDKPFKYYSDGMKARLVFALATSVRPKVLLLDELLSYGDISFHKKADERLHEFFSTSGCVILVTHSVEYARKNADKILYIGENTYYFGDPDTAINLYLEELNLKENTK